MTFDRDAVSKALAEWDRIGAKGAVYEAARWALSFNHLPLRSRYRLVPVETPKENE